MRRLALLALLAACGGKVPAPVDNAGGTSTCKLEIDRTRTPGVVYPGWLAAWTALDANDGDPISMPDGVNAPHDDADARALMCNSFDENDTAVDTCAGAAPWIVWVGSQDDTATFALAAPLPGGQLLVFPHQGTGQGGRCPWFDVVDVDPGAPVGVIAARNEQMMQDSPDGAEACFVTGNEVDYTYVDLAARAQILTIHTQSEQMVTPTPTGVHVTGGGGCAEDVPFTAR